METTAVVHDAALAPFEYRGGMNMPAPPEYSRERDMRPQKMTDRRMPSRPVLRGG